jgi:N-acetylmuramoyl-L-alanine amidase
MPLVVKRPKRTIPLEYISRKWIWFVEDDILQTAPLDFNSEQALRIIGYDTQNLPAAIKAFKLHFIQKKKLIHF